MIELLRVEALETASELRATGEPAAHAHAEVWIVVASVLDDSSPASPAGREVVQRALTDVRRVRSAASSGDVGNAVVLSRQTLRQLARDMFGGDKTFLASVRSLPGPIKTPPPPEMMT